MRGLRNMLSRASPSRSFSLPGSTSASDNGGRREEAALPPAISPPRRGKPGLRRAALSCPWASGEPGRSRRGAAAPTRESWRGGAAPSPSNSRAVLPRLLATAGRRLGSVALAGPAGSASAGRAERRGRWRGGRGSGVWADTGRARVARR